MEPSKIITTSTTHYFSTFLLGHSTLLIFLLVIKNWMVDHFTMLLQYFKKKDGVIKTTHLIFSHDLTWTVKIPSRSHKVITLMRPFFNFSSS